MGATGGVQASSKFASGLSQRGGASGSGGVPPVPEPDPSLGLAGGPVLRPGGDGGDRDGETGDYKTLKVRGGLLKFSKICKTLDAHCATHGEGCKMDRTLRDGKGGRGRPLGRCLAWLSTRGWCLVLFLCKTDLAGTVRFDSIWGSPDPRGPERRRLGTAHFILR